MSSGWRHHHCQCLTFPLPWRATHSFAARRRPMSSGWHHHQPGGACSGAFPAEELNRSPTLKDFISHVKENHMLVLPFYFKLGTLVLFLTSWIHQGGAEQVAHTQPARCHGRFFRRSCLYRRAHGSYRPQRSAFCRAQHRASYRHQRSHCVRSSVSQGPRYLSSRDGSLVSICVDASVHLFWESTWAPAATA